MEKLFRCRKFDKNDLKIIRKHREVMGSCECGRWQIIASNDSKLSPVICRCGNKFYQTGGNQVICERDEY